MKTFSLAIPSEITFLNVPNGISIERSDSNYIEFSDTGRNWPVYIITITSTVALNVLSSYIYDTLKEHSGSERPKGIMIEREDISFDKGEVTKILKEKIKISD